MHDHNDGHYALVEDHCHLRFVVVETQALNMFYEDHACAVVSSGGWDEMQKLSETFKKYWYLEPFSSPGDHAYKVVDTEYDHECTDACCDCFVRRCVRRCINDNWDEIDAASMDKIVKGLSVPVNEKVQLIKKTFSELQTELEEVGKLRESMVNKRAEFLADWNRMASGQESFVETMRVVKEKESGRKIDKPTDNGKPKPQRKQDEHIDAVVCNEGTRKLMNKQEKQRKKEKKKQKIQAEKQRKMEKVEEKEEVKELDQDSAISESRSSDKSEEETVLNEEIFREMVEPRSPEPTTDPENFQYTLKAAFLKPDSQIEYKLLQFHNPQVFIYLETAIQMALESADMSLDSWNVGFADCEGDSEREFTPMDVFDSCQEYRVGLIPKNYHVIHYHDFRLVTNQDHEVVWDMTRVLNKLHWSPEQDEEGCSQKEATVTLTYTIYDECKQRRQLEPIEFKLSTNFNLLDMMCKGFEQAGVTEPQLLEPIGMIKRNPRRSVKASFTTRIENNSSYEALLAVSNYIDEGRLLLYNNENMFIRFEFFRCHRFDLTCESRLARYLVSTKFDLGTLCPYEGSEKWFMGRLIECEPDEELYHIKVMDQCNGLRGFHTIKSSPLSSISDLIQAISTEFEYEHYQLMSSTVTRSNAQLEDELQVAQPLQPNTLYTFVLGDFEME